MLDATRAIEKCLDAGNEERAIDLVKCVAQEGTALDLPVLERLERDCSVKLRYYVRRAIRSIRDRIVTCQTPAPRSTGSATRPARHVARPVPVHASPAEEEPAFDASFHALAEELAARVESRPARRLDGSRPEMCPLPDAELVRLALDLDGHVESRPAARCGERRRLSALDRVDVDRLADYFDRCVLDRPAVRLGGADPADLDSPAMASLLAELAAGSAARARLDLDASFLDPAIFSAADMPFGDAFAA